MITDTSEPADHGGNIISIAKKTGKDINDFLDFSSNINELIDPAIYGYSKMVHRIEKCNYFRYYPETDYSDIEDKFARMNGVEADMIAVGAGMTPLIYRSLDISNASRSIVLYPSFSEYERALRSRNIAITPIPSDIVRKNPEILKSYSYDFLFIANPDNPTGTLTDHSTLRKILKLSYDKNATVFLDEAFIEFCTGLESASSMVRGFPNLIIGRTLTKITGYPGLRIGYTISSKKIAYEIKSGLESWSIGQEVLEFCRHLDLTHVIDSIKPLEKEREYMIKKLKEMGLDTVGLPSANYITFRCSKGSRQESLEDFLAQKLIIIRNLKKYRGMDSDTFRISIKSREKNNILLRSLKEYLSMQ
ncbi:aminotransferase class I/II-fold pyridoxal phosphate-dependent enzyme [Oxyplasma meridianum]|uniref:Aminotransferase class I/II-fold pyridoxal phosphate-dependent enzyme n=1 Tax=Oxyplasma meridianum TaxID=3073602 RepID=A0AAX4NGD2_9ARCH